MRLHGLRWRGLEFPHERSRKKDRGLLYKGYTSYWVEVLSLNHTHTRSAPFPTDSPNPRKNKKYHEYAMCAQDETLAVLAFDSSGSSSFVHFDKHSSGGASRVYTIHNTIYIFAGKHKPRTPMWTAICMRYTLSKKADARTV
uniref:Uncharacterized protein n=1 Tax=Trichogramma kaykai TaxID=54128 RepID=A0ABD2VZ03_9HYME